MTQIEYDNKMKALNDEYYQAITPLHNAINDINAQTVKVKMQIQSLQSQLLELRTQHIAVRENICQLKQEYNMKKHEVYIDRPMKAEA